MATGFFVPAHDTVRPLRALTRANHAFLSFPRLLAKITDSPACKTIHFQRDMVSNVEEFARLIQEAGLSLAHYAIQFFTFVPDPTGYVTVLHKTDGSLTRCVWHNVPRELDTALEQEASKGVRHVTVGMNGSYVILLNTGVMWWSGVPASLERLLDDAEKRGRAVAVSLINFDTVDEGYTN